MRWHYSSASTWVIAGLVTGAGVLAALALWPGHLVRAAGFAGLTALAASTAASRWRTVTEGTITPPALVIQLSALLLFGPRAMLLVTLAGAIVACLPSLLTPENGVSRRAGVRRAIVSVPTAVLASVSAGAAYAALSGIIPMSWPWRAGPIAVALAVYGVVEGGICDLVVPFVTRRPIGRWAHGIIARYPGYFIAAGIAALSVETIVQRAWTIVPIAAVPLYFAYRAYSRHEERFAQEMRWRHAQDTADRALAMLDREGAIVVWNEAAAALLGCPRHRAIGRSLADVVPALKQTTIPAAIERILHGERGGAVEGTSLRVAVDPRVLELSVIPSAGGATILWRDVSEQARVEQSSRRRAERLALVAEGANDGLWEWDILTNELYMSPRWRALLGLEPEENIGRRDDWFSRVHVDDITQLREAIDAHLAGQTDFLQQEHRLRHEDGTYRPFLCRGMAVRGHQGPSRIAGSLTDITSAVAQERARSMRFRDPLTGLSNRAVFADGLGRKLTELKKGRGARFAVLYLDLDRFKVVNDSLGHLVGDELLTAVSRRLESCLRPQDSIARLGGDEFAILLNGLGDEMQANAIALRIQARLGAPFAIGDREVFTSASIGIAFSRPEYMSPEEIMRDADTAMYQAKTHGKARHELFDAEMHASALDRLGLESDLRRAVQNHAFEVHYQPIVVLSTGVCTGFESLVRWKRNGSSVSPARFIPIAEELGLIEPLGKWVLQQACRTFADWQRRFPDRGLDCITVNVSARQLVQRGFLQLVKQVVHESGLRPSDLRLEITETALMEGPALAAQVLRDIRTFGVKIYLDDFGTGYSSLSHLHKLPVDALKIDRSFVRSLLLDDRPAIVESILALARTMQTGVVAEGVESELQARELERLGCRQAQGYFYSPPLPVAAVESLLASGERLGTLPPQGESSRLAAAS